MRTARGVKGAGRLRRIGENCPSHPPPASSLSQPVPITGEQSCITPYQAQSLSAFVNGPQPTAFPFTVSLTFRPSGFGSLPGVFCGLFSLSLSQFRFETTFAVLLGHRSTLSWSGLGFPVEIGLGCFFFSFCFLSFSSRWVLGRSRGSRMDGMGWDAVREVRGLFCVQGFRCDVPVDPERPRFGSLTQSPASSTALCPPSRHSPPLGIAQLPHHSSSIRMQLKDELQMRSKGRVLSANAIGTGFRP